MPYITLNLNVSQFKNNYLFKLLENPRYIVITDLSRLIFHSHPIPTENELAQNHEDANGQNKTITIRKIERNFYRHRTGYVPTIH